MTTQVATPAATPAAPLQTQTRFSTVVLEEIASALPEKGTVHFLNWPLIREAYQDAEKTGTVVFDDHEIRLLEKIMKQIDYAVELNFTVDDVHAKWVASRRG